ncbi:tetratricopeptide repeat protein [Candidatus Kaiserbacteria bacterium]|nr:tetratricopeptide repeat protein [Candidatus Kaiserbacteria bacterium]
MPPQQPINSLRRRSLDTISIWALFATVVVSLFIFIPSDSVPFGATKTFLLAAGAILTLALYILARLGRGNVIFPPSILIGALWLPVAAYALSSAFSGIPFNSAFWGVSLEPDTLGFMLVAALLGTLAALVLRRAEHYRAYLQAGAYAYCVLVALQVLVLIVGQFAPGTISPSFSIVGSYDDLALLLGLGVIGSLITFRFLELSKRASQALLLAGVGALILLAVANSALVWILLALVSLGLFVESVMRRSSNSSDADLDDIGGSMDYAPMESEEGNRSLLMPLAVLAVSLFFIIGGTLGSALASTLNVNVLSIRPSWQSTISIAQKTYATSPVFGSGPGTFGAEWLKYRDPSLNSTVFWNVDFSSGIGFIPTSFVTTGLLGVLAWIGLIALLVVFGLRTLLRRAPRDQFTSYVAILSFVAALYLFTTAVFSLPNSVVLVLAFVFAGLFVSTMRFAEGGEQWGIIFSRSPRIGFVIVFSLTIMLLASVVAAYTLVGRYIAASKIAGAGSAFSAGNLDAADTAAQNAISFAPSAAAYQIQAGVASSRLNQIIASSTMSASAAQQAFQKALSAGINAALTSTRLAPSDYQSWIALGNLYAQVVPLGVTSAYDSAKTAYEKAQTLNPTNPQIHYILAQLNIANKDTRAAQESLKAAITLKQDYTAAIFLLSQLLVQDGNVKDALASALAAAYFQPNDPNILFQVGILYAAQSDFANAAAALSAAVDANPQFANARYFLSAVYAKRGDYESALAQMEAISAMSEDNAKAVATQVDALSAGRNPFPANLLTISSAQVNP